MRLLFVSMTGDLKGEQALSTLASLGHQTLLLAESQETPADSIALFSPVNVAALQGSRGKFLRCSAIKLLDNEVVPRWVTTPFRVAVLRTKRFSRNGSEVPHSRFREALANLASWYDGWLSGDREQLVPWAVYEKDPGISDDARCFTLALKWVKHEQVERLKRVWIVSKSVNRDIETVRIGQWDVNFCRREIVFPAIAVTQALQFLESWKDCFVSEQTWVRKHHKVPSLFVRFDCIVRDGQLIVYEIEERPAGLGISSRANPDFAAALLSVANRWPQFSVKVSPLRRATDDHLWQEAIGWPQNGTSELVLVRAEPEETEFHSLEPNSVSSLKGKGNKSYGERMGLWKRVAITADLPWDRCFVLKPLCGSKLRDLEIWDPKKRPGSSIRDKVEASLCRNKEMFYQEFFDPMETGIAKFPWMIFRVFFAFDPVTGSWQCLGGNWNARHNLRIHGASDAIFGPAVPE